MRATNPTKRSGVLVLVLLLSSSGYSGELNPPGPPGPTMHSLDEIYGAIQDSSQALSVRLHEASNESRIPIRADDIPLLITTPGSYYFTETIAVTRPIISGIIIAASNVCVDLNGHAFIGKEIGNQAYGAISASGNYRNICVRNGMILNWSGRGVWMEVDGCVVSDIRVERADGIVVGNNCIVENCIVRYSDVEGIDTNSNCIIRNCIVSDNKGHGIETLRGCLISGCIVSRNFRNGIDSAQGDAGPQSDGTVIRECIVKDSGFNGIYASNGVIVNKCTVADSSQDGIRVGSNCHVSENTCNGNSVAGIRCLGSGSRIERNNLDANGSGIVVDTHSNLIIQNSSIRSTPNYLISEGNAAGPVIGSGTLTSVNPWVNVSF